MERLRALERFRSAVIGMDIDRGAIKAVQLAKSAEGYTLQHVGYHRLPPGVIVEGEVADRDLLAAQIKDFWDVHSFRGKSVVLGVANQKVVVRVLDFPRMSPEELSSAIPFEAQDHVPMPLEEAVLDHMNLGPVSEGSDEDRILLVAARRDMIEAYSQALRSGGLKPAGVDVKALALMRSAMPDVLFDDEGAILLLDVGTELTNLVVAQGGRPALTQFLNYGLDAFVHSVSTAADLEWNDAEKQVLNPRVGLGDGTIQLEEGRPGEEEGAGPGGAGHGPQADTEDLSVDPALLYDVRRGLEAASQGLAEEVHRAIEYHQSQPEAREVGQIVLSGEGGLISGLDAYLGELLGIGTTRANAIDKLTANRSNVSDEQLRTMEPVLTIALGLAMEEE